MHATLPLLTATAFPPLRRAGASTLQINLGYRGNQRCGEAIRTADHCDGCTAGQGSSCGGALAAPAGAQAGQPRQTSAA